MGQTIEHTGVVESVEDGHIFVRLLQPSACGDCSVAHLCKNGEKSEKLIDVNDATCTDVKVGDKVVISGSVEQRFSAILWAYVLPTVLLFATLILTQYLIGSDLVSAISSLAVLVPYYILLYVMRKRFSRKFSFKILNIKN